MRRTKRISALVMAMAIVVSLLAAMPLTASAATYNIESVSNETQLFNALSYKPNTTTPYSNGDIVRIYISKSFNYEREFIVNGAYEVRLYLDNNTIRVMSSRPTTSGNAAIYVGGEANLTIYGPGTLEVNVSGSDANYYGIRVEKGEFERSSGANINVSKTGSGGGAVRCEGEITSGKNRSSTAAVTNARVDGNRSRAVEANSRGEITVYNNATASGIESVAAWAQSSGRIDIRGDATASGNDSKAVYTESGSSYIEVRGDVKATGRGSIGAHAYSGDIFIRGSVSGEGSDIRVRNNNKRANDPHLTNQAYQGFSCDVFREGSTRVYVRQGSVGTGWRWDGKYWNYYRNSSLVKEAWVQDGGVWYYLRRDGRMAANEWLTITNSGKEGSGGTRYFFTPSGAMATGWQRVGSYWNYFRSSGIRVTSEWVQTGGTWYYLKSNAAMAANETVRISGVNHRFSASGAWLGESGSGGSGSTAGGSWTSQGGVWYYNKAGGGRAANEWLNIGGIWYYFHGNGAMATGWLLQGNTWYWLKASGAMAANERINIGGKTYIFNASGACTNPY